MSGRLRAALLLLGVLSMTAKDLGAAGIWTRFGKDEGLPDDAVRALALDGQGRLWVGLLDGGLAVRAGERFEPFQASVLGTPHVRGLSWSAAGEMWAATDEGAARIKGSELQWMPRGTPGLVSADLVDVVPQAAGRAWLLPMDGSFAEGDGVSAWDGQKLSAIQPPTGERLESVLTVAADAEGHPLLVTSTGLYKVEGQTLAKVPLEGTPLYRPSPRGNSEESESRRLPPVYLLAARQTADGTLWLVHPRAILAQDAKGFREVLASPDQALGPWIAELADGTVAFTGFHGPLLLAGKDGAVARVELALHSGETVDEVQAGAGGSVWIATEGQGAGLLRVRGSAVERVAGLGGEGQPFTVNALLEDPEGKLWAASDNGLFRLSPP